MPRRLGRSSATHRLAAVRNHGRSMMPKSRLPRCPNTRRSQTSCTCSVSGDDRPRRRCATNDRVRSRRCRRDCSGRSTTEPTWVRRSSSHNGRSTARCVFGAALLQTEEHLDDNRLGQAPETDRARFRDSGLGAAPPFPTQPLISPGRQRPATVMGLAERRRAAVTQPGARQHATRPKPGQRPQARAGQELLDGDPQHGALLVLMRSAQRSPSRFPWPRATHGAEPDADCPGLRAGIGQFVAAAVGHALGAGRTDSLAALHHALATRHLADRPPERGVFRGRGQHHRLPVPARADEKLAVQQRFQARMIVTGGLVPERRNFGEDGHSASSPAACRRGDGTRSTACRSRSVAGWA